MIILGNVVCGAVTIICIELNTKVFLLFRLASLIEIGSVSKMQYNSTATQTAISKMNTQLNHQLFKLVQTNTEYYDLHEA